MLLVNVVICAPVLAIELFEVVTCRLATPAYVFAAVVFRAIATPVPVPLTTVPQPVVPAAWKSGLDTRLPVGAVESTPERTVPLLFCTWKAVAELVLVFTIVPALLPFV